MHHPRGDHFGRSAPVRTFVFVIGTRPEVIKVAPIIRRFAENRLGNGAESVTTGQQSDLLESTLAEFELTPDVAIRHRRNCHTPAVLVSQLVRRLDIHREGRPDCVLAQGDTTTAYAASIAAFYRKVAFVHVEAGLRTPSLDAPFPEEYHRRAIAVSTTLHCAPDLGRRSKPDPGEHRRDKIVVSGNTVIDSLLEVLLQSRRCRRIFPSCAPSF